ncbi:MAG: imelysin family protein [Pseudomonadota bacterium]
MRRLRSLAAAGLAALLSSGPAAAEPDHDAIAARAASEHVRPRVTALAEATAALRDAAAEGCASAELAPLYHAAFDAWVDVQHVAFGPIESGDRRFATQFWPDSRGATAKTVARLEASQDPVVFDPDAFATRSVAARGLMALERLLFEEARTDAAYRCALTAAVASDLARTAAEVQAEWRGAFSEVWARPGPENPLYRAAQDRTRDLYRSLDSGLLSLIDLRLGRPLGTFAKPRPRRAEAWRSERPLTNIARAIDALEHLFAVAVAPELSTPARTEITAAFAAARAAAADAPRPLIDAVAAPTSRIKIEAIQTAVAGVRRDLSRLAAPALGVAGGFNSLDGD